MPCRKILYYSISIYKLYNVMKKDPWLEDIGNVKEFQFDFINKSNN